MGKSLFIFLFASLFIQAQIITGTVYSNEDKTPIPYAKIGVDKENIGVISDEKGKFVIDLTKVDSSNNIKIEVAGFEGFSENVKSFASQNNKEIFLKQKINDIKEVVLTPKVFVDKNWGVNTKTKSVLFVMSPENNKEQYNLETAFQFSTKKRAKIKRINLNVAHITADQPVILRYSIYSEKNGLPDKNISEEELDTQLTADKIKDGTFTLDIDEKNIWVQGRFFVAIHFLNQYKGEVKISAALLRTGYAREFYGEWQKIMIAAPAINIDVKVDKNGKNEEQE